MVAAVLSQYLAGKSVKIQLIESEEIGTLDDMDAEQLKTVLNPIKTVIQQAVAYAPQHEAFLTQI